MGFQRNAVVGWSAVVLVMCVALTSLSGRVDCDDKNITRLLNNQAIVSKQIMCVLEKSPCDQLGRQLKGVFSAIVLYIFHVIHSM